MYKSQKLISKNLGEEIKKLESKESQLLDIAKKLNSGNFYPLDFLSNAIINRSLKLIFGFTTLLKDENFIAASHLVRCHLDNVIRFSASWIVDDPHDFATKVIDGIQIDTLKDKNGKLMKDWYLRNLLNEEYPWITNVYKQSSGYVHFSNKHIFNSIKSVDSNKRTMQFSFSKKDNEIDENLKIEAIQCIDHITEILIIFLNGWYYTKENPDKIK
ncbi:hypothetical protein SAMN05192550_1456 [Flavobacterium glycines]|uniref:Uncharacterized protein n=1 Tax=Flavobacterium glycines TaxID=551990 RepID=A0A1B9DWQ9_9FLAO|nr:hypothetical protein [Flavobacterium glycines]OCB74125.1 hypothetical protein FBGL_02965 [Flavobacterium glycines]GEL09543.1 hypothetical protein FGL01_02820 [Flavobacterium glycines]SDJ03046.1 hypothetical protein SAMN05192550_1456 [Flavobacterium glycines]